MTRKFAALFTAASIAFAAAAPTVQAMEQEFNMLTGKVYNELKTRGLPTDNIDNLSLSDIAIIVAIINSDESEGNKTQRIEAVLNR